MPIKGYGLWRCTLTAWDPNQKPDHGHLTFTDDSGGTFDAAVNVMSRSRDGRLVYWLVRDFDQSHPLAAKLSALPAGFHAARGPTGNGLALDLLRGDLVDIRSGVILSHDGSANDIIDYLNPILNQAVEAEATTFLYGQQYYPGKDGIHDIHMNQGSAGGFTRDNGVWQDGGIILSFPDGHWEAIFLAFASQASVTDDAGQPAGPLFSDILSVGAGPAPGAAAEGIAAAAPPSPVSIEAALAAAPAPSVFLLNRSTEPVSLGGWTIENAAGQRETLGPDAVVPGLAKMAFPVPSIPVGGGAGEILLKNAAGDTVHQVSYTEAQAKRQGALLYFQGTA